ncbi:MAG: BlaI/MecI/CopY family transcriptional regulator [Mariniblastus sp.]
MARKRASAGKTNVKPAELELLILKILWQSPPDELPLPVRDVRAKLAELGRELAHTTVITTLNVMVDKGFLKRTKHKNAFRFIAQVSEKDVHGSAINEVLSRVFDGSAEHLMLALLDSKNVDANDISEIKKLINKKAKELNK